MGKNQKLEGWDDFAEPVKVTKKQSEAAIQKQCVDWARKRGWWARKFVSQQQRSVPDYLFGKRFAEFEYGYVVARPSVKLAVEFKKPGNVSTQAQWDEQYLMWEAGWQVEECDSFEKFKRIIIAIEEQYA